MPRRVPSATAAFPLADAVRPVRADPDHVGDDQQRRVLQRQRLLPALGSKAASRSARRERRRLCDLLHEVPWPLTADPALGPDRGLDAGSAGQRRGLHRARGLIGRRAVFRWWSVGCGMKGPQMAKTHLAHKAEHGVDMDTGAIVSVTVQDASEGDSATLPETLTMAAEQVELVQPDGPGVEEVVADKGYHSDKTLVALDEIGIRSYVSEPERGQRCWQDKKTGETPPEKRAAQRALYGNRRRIRGARGRRLQRGRSELVERPFAHQYETGGLRRVWVRGHDNVRKRVLIQAAGCNIGLLLRRLTGVGTPRSLQGRALSAIYGLIGRLIDRWGRLTSPWGSKWETGGVRRLNRSSPSCLNTPAQRTDFFHGLLSHVALFPFCRAPDSYHSRARGTRHRPSRLSKPKPLYGIEPLKDTIVYLFAWNTGRVLVVGSKYTSHVHYFVV